MGIQGEAQSWGWAWLAGACPSLAQPMCSAALTQPREAEPEHSYLVLLASLETATAFACHYKLQANLVSTVSHLHFAADNCLCASKEAWICCSKFSAGYCHMVQFSLRKWCLSFRVLLTSYSIFLCCSYISADTFSTQVAAHNKYIFKLGTAFPAENVVKKTPA